MSAGSRPPAAVGLLTLGTFEFCAAILCCKVEAGIEDQELFATEQLDSTRTLSSIKEDPVAQQLMFSGLFIASSFCSVFAGLAARLSPLLLRQQAEDQRILVEEADMERIMSGGLGPHDMLDDKHEVRLQAILA